MGVWVEREVEEGLLTELKSRLFFSLSMFISSPSLTSSNPVPVPVPVPKQSFSGFCNKPTCCLTIWFSLSISYFLITVLHTSSILFLSYPHASHNNAFIVPVINRTWERDFTFISIKSKEWSSCVLFKCDISEEHSLELSLEPSISLETSSILSCGREKEEEEEEEEEELYVDAIVHVALIVRALCILFNSGSHASLPVIMSLIISSLFSWSTWRTNLAETGSFDIKLFRTGWFSIFFIRAANRKVDNDSHPWLIWGQIQAIMKVWLFPPKESLSKYVSLDCLYGIWSLLLCVNAITTCSKKVKDLLMWLASFCRLPKDPVFSTLSLPAKSIKCNLLFTTSGSMSAPKFVKTI